MELALPAIVVVVALLVVVAPLLRRERTYAFESDAELDAAVARYSNALRSDTVCARCLEANPEQSRYCMRCGKRIGNAR